MTSESDQALNGINWEYLCQHWVPSDEERLTEEYHSIYRPEGFIRPEGYKRPEGLPPRFGSVHLIFYENGDCKLCLWDMCGYSQTMPGKWRIDPNDKSILQVFYKDGTAETYRIFELTKTILRIVHVGGS